MSIVYEVNVKVAYSILGEFTSWLHGHIQEMLNQEGFTHAQIFEEIPATTRDDFQTLIIQYRIETLSALEHYFAHHASAMREKGIAKFGEQISATRRVFRKFEVIDAR